MAQVTPASSSITMVGRAAQIVPTEFTYVGPSEWERMKQLGFSTLDTEFHDLKGYFARPEQGRDWKDAWVDRLRKVNRAYIGSRRTANGRDDIVRLWILRDTWVQTKNNMTKEVFARHRVKERIETELRALHIRMSQSEKAYRAAHGNAENMTPFSPWFRENFMRNRG